MRVRPGNERAITRVKGNAANEEAARRVHAVLWRWSCRASEAVSDASDSGVPSHHPGDSREGDKSGHGKKLTEQGAFTLSYQSEGKAIMHSVITASVFPFPRPKLGWVHPMAVLILSSMSPLCTATSMRETVPPLSALAVVSRRSTHRCPGLCISAEQISIQHAFIS